MNFKTLKRTFNKLFISYFFILIIIFSLVLILFSQILINSNYEIKINTLIENENIELELLSNQISTMFYNLKEEIILLSLDHELISYGETLNENYLNDFKLEMLQLLIIKKHYDQIRYINSTGFEIARVNDNNSNPYIVPENELQNKSNKYYFTESIELNKNEIFISPLDLNIENGKIEIPYKPTIRFATPVFTSNDTKTGIIIIDYHGNEILKIVSEDYDIYTADNHYLVNINGNIYKSISNVSEEWGFILPHNTSFNIKYNFVLIDLYNSKSGGIKRFDGIYSYYSFNPLESEHSSLITLQNELDHYNEKSYNWLLISYLSEEKIQTIRTEIINSVISISISILFIFIIFSLLISYLLAHAREKEKLQNKNIKYTNDLLKKQKHELYEFAHNMNHDIKNYLTKLSQYISLFSFDQDKEHLRSMNIQIGKLEILLEHSLKLADLGLVIDKKEEVDFVKLLDEFSLSNKNIKFKYEHNFPIILGDEQKIQQMMSNIISNAYFHGNANEIEVKFIDDSEHGFYNILIINNGLSINENIKNKIFNKGFTTKVDSKGEFGLGMHIVSKICNSHGWSIQLKDNLEVTFEIQIPESDIKY